MNQEEPACHNPEINHNTGIITLTTPHKGKSAAKLFSLRSGRVVSDEVISIKTSRVPT